MRKILFLIVLISFVFSSCSSVKDQQKKDYTLDKSVEEGGDKFITRAVTKDEYKALFERFEANDTTLTLSDYNALYYGQPDQEGFLGYGASTAIQQKLISEILTDQNPSKEDWLKAYEVGKNVADMAPFDIENKYFCYISSKNAGKIDESKKWFYKFNKLVDGILSSGDGLTAKTAFKVMCVRDEYVLLKILGLKFTSQALAFEEDTPFDIMSVETNDYGVEKVYFDISSFFGKF